MCICSYGPDPLPSTRGTFFQIKTQVFNAGAYNTTIYAKQGDLGTKVLKPRPSGTVRTSPPTASPPRRSPFPSQ